MADKPFDIIGLQGINNKLSPESIVDYAERARAASTYLTEAMNTDITMDGRAVRRRGFSLSLAGDCHSLWWGNEIGFVVKDNRLGSLDSSLTFTDLYAASPRPVSYADTDVGVYISDGQFVARYITGFEILAKAGTYEPTANVLDPSEDDTIYDYPPAGYMLVWMFGRLWSVTDDAVYYSRGYLPDQFNLADDYIDQPGVTLLAPVSDGYYIGTDEKVQFVSSPNPKAPAKVTDATKTGATLGSQVITDAKLFGVDGATGPAVVWESREGKVLGLSGGRTVKLTYDNAVYPTGARCASMMRELNGEIHHVSSIGTRDSDTSNMRTTDVAIAEVIRNGVTI